MDDEDEVKLALFVTRGSPRCHRVEQKLRALHEKRSLGDCELSIIDVVQRPSLAEDYHILFTPTLVKVSPQPAARISGDIPDDDQLLDALGLAPRLPGE